MKFIDRAPISTWALLGAGIVQTALQVGMVLVIWLGTWTPEREEKRLLLLGGCLMMLSLGNLAVILSLARARVSAQGPGNLHIDVSGGGVTDNPPPTAVRVTTEVNKQ